MKLAALIVLFAPFLLAAQNTWIQRASLPGPARYGASGFSIGEKGYIVTGRGTQSTSINSEYNDLWEYDPAIDSWTQKADFPGPARQWASSFAIGDDGYVAAGANFTTPALKDLWAYHSLSNIWERKADLPSFNWGASGFSMNGKGYVIAGNQNPNGVYEYDPALDTWQTKNPFPGWGRLGATGFTIEDRIYFGGGYALSPYYTFATDFWEYDPAADTWTSKAPLPYGAEEACSFSIGHKGYTGTGYTSGYLSCFYQYDVYMDTWNAITNIPLSRWSAVGFSIRNKGYVGTGESNGVDLEEYSPQLAAWFLAGDRAVCPGDSIAFYDQSVSGITSWSWSFPGGSPSSSTLKDPVISYNIPGTYDVHLIVSGTNGTDTLHRLSYITVDTVVPLIFGYERSIYFTGESNPLPVITSGNGWFSGSPGLVIDSLTGEIDIAATGVGQFTVTCTSTGNCRDESNVLIRIEEPFTIPNVITPNSDGINDAFAVQGNGIELLNGENIQPLGKEIFRLNDKLQKWDAPDCSAGTYYYELDLVVYGREPLHINGYFTVIK